MEILAPEHLAVPEDGFGLQQAVLEEVASSERAPAALFWTSSQFVAVTRLEAHLPGFDEAVKVARGAGFPVLVRNSGGGAVAANEGSVSFSLTFPVRDLRHGLYERYSECSDLIVSALQRLSVAAEAGEVEGEFCPGAYSIRTGGSQGIKVAGLAQRVTRRAARVEALILVNKTSKLVPVLESVYQALNLPFRSRSVGDLPVDVRQVIEALTEEVQQRYGARQERLGEGLFRRARFLRGRWQVPAR